MEQLFLHQPRQPVDEVAQAAEGADVAAEESAEQDGEPAQPQQGEHEAVELEHAAGANAEEDLLDAVEPGDKSPRHGKEEDELDARPQPRAVFELSLPLLGGGERSGLRFHLMHPPFPVRLRRPR